jgi:hypothetical protein
MIEICMPDEEKEYLISCLDESNFYLEYGSGGSTLEGLKKVKKGMITVESDKAFLEKVLSETPPNPKPKFLPMVPDLGPIGDWGYPTSAEKSAHFYTYSVFPWITAQRNNFEIDTVLVDGRWRVACVITSICFSKRPIKILLDDYDERPFYHGVEGIAGPPKMVGRIAVFNVDPKNIPAQFILENLHMFADPR